MGITPNDIAAQRAMLERGEEKRKADWKLAERERLRDTFAAAALTGWLASQQTVISQKEMAIRAYDYADAMLRDRDRHHIPDAGNMVENTTNHDAVPDARARDADRGRNDKAVARPGDGTGNTPEPESYDQSDEKRTNTDMNRTIDRKAYEGDIVSRLRHWRGLHLAHSGDLFDEAADEIERLRLELSVQKACTVAGREEIARLREAIRRLADQDATLSVQEGNVTVTLDATLTGAERWAIHDAAKAVAKELDLMDGEESLTTATLRSLLERLK